MIAASEPNSDGDRKTFKGRLVLTTGQPLQLVERVAIDAPLEASPLSAAIARTLRVYRDAACELLEGKYAEDRDIVPAHLRSACHILVLSCTDGILVRYDATDEVPKVRIVRSIDAPLQRLTDAAPAFSENLIHVADDPANYVPKQYGPGWRFMVQGGEVQLHPIVIASLALPPDLKVPPPSSRPPRLATLTREVEVRLKGDVLPFGVAPRAISPPPGHFIAHKITSLPVGWQAIEIYPLLGEEYWKPEYAAAWAELDILAAIAQRNAVKAELTQPDGHRAAREQYLRLFEQFESLLVPGHEKDQSKQRKHAEEPVHQFLKSNPELLCPTHEPGRVWSKLAFGSTVSDFVFREAGGSYLLVEIEAPTGKLFKKNGHLHHELKHAIDQIDDWVEYIQTHHAEVEEKLGLVGTPRQLVVIGRSSSLNEQNRKKLAALTTQRPRLEILTYDDVVERARANLECILGPMSIRSDLDLYFYRDAPPGVTLK